MAWTEREKEGWLYEYEGELVKSGFFRREKFVTTKRRFWFLLNKGKLYRFGTSNLNHLSKPTKTIVCQSVEKSQGYSFKVNSSSLWAESEQDQNDWIAKIGRTRHSPVVVNEHVPPKKYPVSPKKHPVPRGKTNLKSGINRK
ncbi:hypothetical protein ACHQM5_003484 [Ranunculus cassubicifolius]